MTMAARRLAAAMVAAAVLAASRAPRAQTSDPAAAAELFRQGRAALDAKDYEMACGRLLESLRLDARVGTLISLGECEEARGQLAAAQLRWRQAAQLARRIGDARAAYCDERVAAIDPRVPRLTIRFAPGVPPGTFVRRDSVDVGPAAIGVALPIEVGHHVVVALAPRHDARTYPVDGEEGKSTELVVEPGGPLPDLPMEPDDIPPGLPVVGTPVAPFAAPEPPRVAPWLRPVSAVAGVLALAGVAAGTYFGIRAIQGASDSAPHCTGNDCDAQGTQQRRDAILAGNLSTGAFVEAGVMAGLGTLAFVLSLPRQPVRPVRVAPAVSARGGGVSVVGSW